MKIKSLAMLAASGLMAASLAYVMPAYADDEFSDVALTADQGASDNNPAGTDNMPGTGSANSNPSTNNAMGNNAGNNTGANAGAATGTTGNSGTNGANGTSGTNGGLTGGPSASNNTGAALPADQGTPDVASGDDDY
jgi:hypothetical protein